MIVFNNQRKEKKYNNLKTQNQKAGAWNTI